MNIEIEIKVKIDFHQNGNDVTVSSFEPMSGLSIATKRKVESVDAVVDESTEVIKRIMKRYMKHYAIEGK